MSKNNIFHFYFKDILQLSSFPFFYFILHILFKYFNHNLSIKEFDFFYIGNFIIFIFVVVLIIELIILGRINKGFRNSKNRFLWLGKLSLFFLIIGEIIYVLNLPLEQIYILREPLDKVLVAFLFFISFFILLIWMFSLWFNLLFKNEKSFINSTITSIFCIIIIFLFTIIYTNKNYKISNQIENKKNKSEIAVVLGAAVWSNNKPSDILISRLNKALELLNFNLVDKIQLTGSNAPGELTEAEVALNYIKNFNVDTNKILVESNTTSTNEQIQFIKNELIKKQKYKNIIIISDKYHIPRINEIAKFFNLKISCIASDFTLQGRNLFYYRLRESLALLFFWLFGI